MKKSFKSIIAVVLIILLQVTVPLQAGAQDNSSDDGLYDYMRSMVDMIKTRYNGVYDEKTVVQGLLKGLFSNFDPYTTYMTNDEAASFFNSMSGSVSGIGVQLIQSSNDIVVYKVLPDSPAEKAGIIEGDIITAVDDKSVVGASYDDVSAVVRGEEGSAVKVAVKRNNSVKEYSLTRQTISVLPGSYRIDNGIGYIKLEKFTSNSADFISQALAYMDSNGVNKIVLDLRDNPGGEVDQAVQIASHFVKGVIASLDYKDASMQDKVYRSPLQETKYKLAVLVNGNSASASEIVTGAIQDSKAGVIIGSKTFGKAKVQNLFPILTPEAYEKYKKILGVDVIDAFDLIDKYNIRPYESEIQGRAKITTGMYRTPNGRMIDLQGIEPDIQVNDSSVNPFFNINEMLPLSSDSIVNNGMTEKDIVNMKKFLLLAGYNITDISNTVDSGTITQLSRFQQERNIQVTGQLDAVTIDALNNVLSLAKMMDNRSYSKAVEVLNQN